MQPASEEEETEDEMLARIEREERARFGDEDDTQTVSLTQATSFKVDLQEVAKRFGFLGMRAARPSA